MGRGNAKAIPAILSIEHAKELLKIGESNLLDTTFETGLSAAAFV